MLVAAEADRLDELRLAAAELRVEADLAGGGAAGGLAAELGVLVAEHPLRERLWHQLMRVLWQDGRPAEALEVYARARQVLAEELGADPGPGLQDLYQRILAGEAPPTARQRGDGPEPAAGAAPVAARPTLPVPGELPLDVAAFTGRAGELARADRLLDPRPAKPGAVVISAIGGHRRGGQDRAGRAAGHTGPRTGSRTGSCT